MKKLKDSLCQFVFTLHFMMWKIPSLSPFTLGNMMVDLVSSAANYTAFVFGLFGLPSLS